MTRFGETRRDFLERWSDREGFERAAVWDVDSALRLGLGRHLWATNSIDELEGLNSVRTELTPDSQSYMWVALLVPIFLAQESRRLQEYQYLQYEL